jgi:uncharacterized protein YdhG (YjbR/CyaY superfamily)
LAGNSAFSDVEKEAMKARAKEAREFKKLSGEQQIKLKLEEMSKSDKALALKVHKLVLQTAPELEAKTWYGMPAYYLNDKVICFFQSASKFKVRYCTFGFQEAAQVDDGEFWPTSYALTKMTPEVEKKLAKLVKKAVGR